MNLVPQFAQAADLPGHVKVRLFYHTWHPSHVRSQVLSVEMNMDPPYVEDISVLLPPDQVLNQLGAYESVFNDLRLAGFAYPADKLKNFEIRDEDVRTLAYYPVTGEPA